MGGIEADAVMERGWQLEEIVAGRGGFSKLLRH